MKELGVYVYERVIKLYPSKYEDFIEYLIENEYYEKGLKLIHSILEENNFQSSKKKSKHDYWLVFCEIVSLHGDKLNNSVNSLNIEYILRSGLQKYKDQAGNLWCTLADYFIKNGDFNKAMKIYKESLDNVLTVRDFSVVFDAYAQFLETLVSAKIEIMKENNKNEEKITNKFGLLDKKFDNEIDLLLFKLNYLLEQRPFLLNNVMLRQNPNNVNEWKKKVKLNQQKEDKDIIEKIYDEAITNILFGNTFVGKVSELYINFSKFYEKQQKFLKAEKVFLNVLKRRDEITNQETIINLLCSFCEFYLRQKQIDKTKSILNQVFHRRKDRSIDYPINVRKSVRLWTLRADLEMTFGTISSSRAILRQMTDLKVLTPTVILQYALYFEENELFEESFTVYERGVNVFAWPESSEIWMLYLSKFVNRYEGQKLDRGREIFNEALAECPMDYKYPVVLLYISYEENYGFMSKVMEIFATSRSQMVPKERFNLSILSLKKSLKFYGLLKTRKLFEDILEESYKLVYDFKGYEYTSRLAIYFAQVEKSVGEIERARAVFQYASQFCDPGKLSFFWDSWYQLELEHGTATSFKEMLRVKRSAIAQFGAGEETTKGFVKSSNQVEDSNQVDQLMEDEKNVIDNNENNQDPVDIGIDQKEVPASVFSGLQT